MRVTWLAAALGIAIGIAPSAGAAQVPTLGSEGCDTACTFAWIGGALGGAALAIGEVYLLVDGFIKASHGHGHYEAGGVFEVIIGLAHLAPAAVASWALVDQENYDTGFVGLGLASGVLGLYFFVHGLWSLGDGRPPPSHFSIGMTPQPGGATLSASGVF